MLTFLASNRSLARRRRPTSPEFSPFTLRRWTRLCLLVQLARPLQHSLQRGRIAHSALHAPPKPLIARSNLLFSTVIQLWCSRRAAREDHIRAAVAGRQEQATRRMANEASPLSEVQRDWEEPAHTEGSLNRRASRFGMP